MKWAVAIFSSRETLETLSSSINAALVATSQADTTIDVIVNGNRSLAIEVGSYIRSIRSLGRFSTLVRVWYVPVGDKAHAWNQYLYEIWPESDIGYFIDGYVQVMPDALNLIWEGLATAPGAIAASGVPTMGRSARALRERLLSEGGVHGNLYALRGSTMAQLKSLGFRLPLGIYRTDPLLIAVICFGLDPSRNEWDTRRILVHPQATWRFRPLNWWSPRDLRTHLNRVIRQAQGTLENLAIREHFAIQKNLPQSLPKTTSQLVGDWVSKFPAAARRTFVRSPLCFLAARSLRRPRDWSQAKTLPELIAQTVVPWSDGSTCPEVAEKPPKTL
jgi:hypothetical protein